MTLHLKSRGYPFRPRLLFSSFIVVGFGSPNCVLFQERTIKRYLRSILRFLRKNFAISSEEIEMSLLILYYNASALLI